MKKIRAAAGIVAFVSIFAFQSYTANAWEANTQVPGLEVRGRYVYQKGADHPFVIKAINLNDNMEFPYGPWQAPAKPRTFQEIMSWTHTVEDYRHIKEMGFNAVRVNLSSEHFKNMDRIRQHVDWARLNGLYVILTYFTVPGCKADSGYYTDEAFWQSLRDGGGPGSFYQTYLDDWARAFREFQEDRNVMFEMINEPQLKYLVPENVELYKTAIRNIAALLQQIGNTHILIIDGLDYAGSNYADYSFIPDIKGCYDNLVFSFHYYMTDFVFHDCHWNTPSATLYRDKKAVFEAQMTGDKTVSFNFSLAQFNDPSVINPFFDVVSWSQIGRYNIDSIVITGPTKDDIVYEESFSNKQMRVVDSSGNVTPYDPENPPVNGNIVLYDTVDPYRSWSTIFGGRGDTNPSAKNSDIRLLQNRVMIDNTLPVQNSGNWAVLSNLAYMPDTQWGNYVSPIVLNPAYEYTFSIVMSGENLSDHGGLNVIFFDRKDNGDGGFTHVKLFHPDPLYPTDPDKGHFDNVRTLCWGDWMCNEYYLCSDRQRLEADFAMMRLVSEEHDVPLFLGEFGVPARVDQNEAREYLQAIVESISGLAGWAIYVYRMPFSNRLCDKCSEYITFALYSGFEVAVKDMGDKSAEFGVSDHFYRKTFIQELKNLLGPTAITGAAGFVTSRTATLNGTVNPNGVATSYFFEYGLTAAYGKTTLSASAGLGTSNVPVALSVSGLSPGATYHFRIVADRADGTTCGSDNTFATIPLCAKCTGDPVFLSNVTFTSGTNCECAAATSITIGSGTVIKNGARICFRAPKVVLQSGFYAEPGAMVCIGQQ